MTNEKYLKVFEHAEQMEVDGKDMYEKELERTESPGLRKILKMLIKAEENHYDIFVALRDKHDVPVVKTDMKEIKNIFTEMKESEEKLIVSEEHIDFYEKVRDIEVKAEKYFRENAEAAKADGDEKMANIFFDLAEEERRHVVLMETLVEMTRHPLQWIEDAEWNNMEEF